MIFIIGGYAQGKLSFAKSLIKSRNCQNSNNTIDCMITEEPLYPGSDSDADGFCIFHHINIWARKTYSQNPDPEFAWNQICAMHSRFPDLIMISEEIGNGIVPMDRDERLFREWMGRLQCRIAAESDQVYRVHCGLAQKIKG